MKRKVIAIVQARTDSSRLPHKVLKHILGKPMIIHQLERIKRSTLIDKLILTTSDEESDNILADSVSKNNFNIFRGDKNNVLKRFFDTVKNLNLADDDIIVRLTGDCPLHDPYVIDEAIQEFITSTYDYLANCIEPIYPDGLDVEVFTYKSLHIANNEASKISEQEHVTPYIRNCGKFKTKNLLKKPMYPTWRLTVDEESDFQLINNIYMHFNNNNFSIQDIIKFLESNPDLLSINSNIMRNEGYEKSLKKEQNAR